MRPNQFAVALALLLCGVARGETAPAMVKEFSTPPLFSFLGWDKSFKVEGGGLHIHAPNCQGGVGYGLTANLSPFLDRTPALTLTVNAGNKAKLLIASLLDADGTRHEYHFKIEGLAAGATATVLASDGASLNEPNKLSAPGKEAGLDAGNLSQMTVQGDWAADPVDVTVKCLELVAPTDEIKAAHAKLRELHAKEAEKARLAVEAKAKARQQLLEKGAPHPADGPEIQHLCAVAPEVLSITLQAGKFVPNALTPYVAQPGDEIVEESKQEKHYIVKGGQVLEDYDKALFRSVGGKRTRIATLSPDGKDLFKEGKTSGQFLEELAVDAAAAYSLQSADDPAYARPTSPLAVFRKGKPDGNSRPLPFVYYISLQLPSPLKEGATYTLHFIGVNTSKETVTYVHNPRQTQSDAVHAIQTGYRPDDPYKRAYLSIWLGACVEADKSGGYTHHVESFELTDAATGKTVFTGKPELTKAQDAKETLNVHPEGTKDFTLTAVHRLDFSAFKTPGEYRVYVPGIGVSGVFQIAENVWEKPFKTAMLGILAQRQGIELGPPACAFKRARAFHPDDGVEFYQMSITEQEGQEGERGKNMAELAKAGKLQRVTGIWGGYQDAGDWDTLGNHLNLTWLLLELYQLAPEYFAKVKLSLPPSDQAQALPSLLDEALWQMPCFRRLQLPDGSVRGGYGEGWGCRRAQTSPMVKSVGVYAPDHVTSYHYAACAARAYLVLSAFDKKLAAEYLESGQCAWAWAEAHSNDNDETYKRLMARKGWPGYAGSLRNARVLAAVDLYAATGEAPYHEAFKKSTELAGKGVARYMDQPDADFAYARLPDKLADPALKQRAIDTITSYADYAIDFSHKNAFELINGSRTDLPVIGPCTYFSAPGVRGYSLVRACVLAQKPAYLAAVVQACNYSLGANPDNLSYCPGLGHKFVRFPFKVDAAVSGQYPDQPTGYIPYGQGDEGSEMCRGGSGWVQQWYLNFLPPKMIPNCYTWPPNEVYIDFGISPMMNENTLNSTTLAAAYFWGFLASRP